MTAPIPETQPVVAHDVMPAWAIRLEAKVDVALTQHAARLDTHAAEIADHEARLREVESRRTVSPAGLWAAVLGGVSGAAALVGVITNLLPH